MILAPIDEPNSLRSWTVSCSWPRGPEVLLVLGVLLFCWLTSWFFPVVVFVFVLALSWLSVTVVSFAGLRDLIISSWFLLPDRGFRLTTPVIFRATTALRPYVPRASSRNTVYFHFFSRWVALDMSAYSWDKTVFQRLEWQGGSAP